MAAYDKAAVASAKALLQQDNDSWESLPKYEVDHKPAYISSTLPTIHNVDIVPSGLEKLKSRFSAAKEARDRRASLYEAWQRKLPTLYAKQTYPTAESYPPHRVELARLQRHQSWYPHYQFSTSDCDVKPDASKVEELNKVTYHQSWYPHYKTSGNDARVEPDAEKVEDLKKETRHQSWYPHYKISTSSSGSASAEPDSAKAEDSTEPNRHQSRRPHFRPSSSSGAGVAAAKVGSLKERIVSRVSRMTNLGIDDGLKAACPRYTAIEC